MPLVRSFCLTVLCVSASTAITRAFNFTRARHLEVSADDLSLLKQHFQRDLIDSFYILNQAPYLSVLLDNPPWAGDYMPAHKDGPNFRSNPYDYSPIEKYAMAFGLNPTEVMDRASAAFGVDALATTSPVCTSNLECMSLPGNNSCSFRLHRTQGYCVPHWWGMCHAWALASVLEDEPRCPVNKNGVTFQIIDIKALLTVLYNDQQLDTIVVGHKYEGPSNAPKDQFGRPLDPTLRDVGPGLFHIVLANLLVDFKQAVICDVEKGSEIWNFPVTGYQVHQMELVDPAYAAQMYFGSPTYQFNPAMVHLAFVHISVYYVSTTTDPRKINSMLQSSYIRPIQYTYLLELDTTGRIIGGEWVLNSVEDHPDFFWLPMNSAKGDWVSLATGIDYANVKALLTASLACTG
uniref:Transglutaminase elicitor M81C putative n=1 Tax=Albugo laibachii Nc14 TaxID=890382 RepID=F0VZK0_9STRA|nr:transglutaminase elicitor M81C putative [Albugo laibachii Nc14]|eukprot:CCA14230.1 transglutaminase elicitor M81C putative [Albugo laibachii Nc14]